MTKITSLTALTGAGVDTANDVLPIVDVSVAGASGNKKITVAELLTAFNVPEIARDTLGTALVAGANVTITPNDGADTITIDAATGGAIEVLDEGVSETALLVSLDFTGTGVSAADDGSGNVTVTIPGGISTFALGDATDVDTSGAAAGNVLAYDGAQWEPTASPAAWQLAGTGQTATGVYNFAVDGAKADVDFTGLSGFNELLIVCRALTVSVSGLRRLLASVDNGSTFFNSSGDYVAIETTGVETGSDNFAQNETATTAGRSLVVQIVNLKGAAKFAHMNRASRYQTMFVASASAINAIRINNSAGGNITGGTIRVYGR